MSRNGINLLWLGTVLFVGFLVGLGAAAVFLFVWPADPTFDEIKLSSLYSMGFNERRIDVASDSLDVHKLRREFLNSYAWSGVTQKNVNKLWTLAALEDESTANAISKSIVKVDHGLFGNQSSLWFISYVTPEAAIPVLIEVVRHGGTKGRSANSCLSCLAIRSCDYKPEAPTQVADQWVHWYESEGQETSCFQRLQLRLRDRGISLTGEDDRDGLLRAVKCFPLDERYGDKAAFLRNDGVPEETLIAMALSTHLCDTFQVFNISPAGFPMNSPDKSWIDVHGVQAWSDWEAILKKEPDAVW